MSTREETETPDSTPVPGIREVPPAERFLQHALGGTQTDVRLPSVLLALVAVATSMVWLVRRRQRDRTRDVDDAQRHDDRTDGAG